MKKILKLKQENPAIFAWEIRDLLRRELINCNQTATSQSNPSTSSAINSQSFNAIPSISSINRILRNGNNLFEWQNNGSSKQANEINAQTSESSVCVIGVNESYTQQQNYASYQNTPTFKKTKKYKSYSIEEILKEDNDDNKSDNSNSANTNVMVAENYNVQNAMTVQQQLYYSYYYQALFAANYNASNLNGNYNANYNQETNQHQLTTVNNFNFNFTN